MKRLLILLLFIPLIQVKGDMDVSSNRTLEEIKIPSIYAMKENENSNDLKILVFKGMENDQEQLIYAYSVWDDGEEKQWILINKRLWEEEQKIISDPIPEWMQKGQEIRVFSNGFLREVLSFKEMDWGFVQKILTNRDGQDTTEEVIPDPEEESDSVVDDDVENGSGQDETDVEHKEDPVREVILENRASGARMILQVFAENEEGVARAVLKMEHLNGIVEKEIELPNEKDFKEIIKSVFSEREHILYLALAGGGLLGSLWNYLEKGDSPEIVPVALTMAATVAFSIPLVKVAQKFTQHRMAKKIYREDGEQKIGFGYFMILEKVFSKL